MRKSILAGATALAVAATGLAVTAIAGTARPATAAIGDVPADCRVSTTAYRADGQRLTYTYDGGRTSTTETFGDTLPWVPSANQQLGASGDDTVIRTTEIAAHPTSGWLFKVSRELYLAEDGTWHLRTMSASHLTSGFAGTRILATGSPYLFRVAGSAIYRYKEKYVDGVFTYSAPVKLAAVGWDSVNTLVHEGTRGTGSNTVDVLIGTKKNGELREWSINRATGKITAKTLRSSGWASFTSLSTGLCEAHPNGRPLLAITADGRASVHFDADKSDGVATDMKGASLGSLGWTAKGYGQ